ncbi:Tripartite-type tricarboxylate transporter, receptor component TctC [Paracoccus alcaliphilus]|uniref:Tripartite-type tricarboxylate transporter, receptor component TctC n=1 Tax=Paracoccus alcaliphilus TaxID=34002 RepID=A0A1H8L656_9RHOB|nr:tripartite tricarboxylate transporter substrate-binding protein [Paracoccus alcaliphilus]WCR19222.1 tripartite tricarboxylate transporter substrate binding protein BugD [Paracoccus alcaliphilus]SEO00634.1 Tripartite-type tricarboxylate transporter, receptor component TctC [Paracoccus alcaliphilus]
MKKITLFTAAAALAAGAAWAQDYPTQPINVVVPFAAGGPTDTVTRLVAQAMSRELGQQIVVENVGGAGGTLGAARVAQANADGYTLLLHHIGMSTAPSLYRELPFDPLTDFEYIGLVTEVPMVFVGRNDLEVDTLEDAIAWIREEGENVMYANAGIGAASHLCGLLFMNSIDTQMTTIPYQGTAPAVTDLMGGQVDFLCDQTTNTTQQIRDGSIKPFAVTVPERLDSLPDLPTTAEAGLGDFEITIWHGLYAPAGTPDEVVSSLTAALQTALQDETVIERFADLGTAPSPQEDATPEALKAKVESEIELWRPLIDAAGVYAN